MYTFEIKCVLFCSVHLDKLSTLILVIGSWVIN